MAEHVLPTRDALRHRGAVAYCAGLAAEDAVAAEYGRRGQSVAYRRWRGKCGEIDLIARGDDGFVFVEVKRARSFDAAIGRLGRRQMDRIMAAALEFLGLQPGGLVAAMRFDLALVDSLGRVRLIENAFGEV